MDVILIAYKDKREIAKLKRILNFEFDMKDLGLARRILGIDRHRYKEKGVLTLS